VTLEKTKRPVFANRDAQRDRVGKYLMQRFHDTNLSRREAAERAGVSEGTLTTILAGRTAFPAEDIVRNMSRNWGFPYLDFLIRGTGLVKESDVDEYIQAKDLTPATAPPELKALNARLMAAPPQRRRALAEALLNTLTIIENAT
jgi:transcriptional regulator with XRE-family HTH domain